HSPGRCAGPVRPDSPTSPPRGSAPCPAPAGCSATAPCRWARWPAASSPSTSAWSPPGSSEARSRSASPCWPCPPCSGGRSEAAMTDSRTATPAVTRTAGRGGEPMRSVLVVDNSGRGHAFADLFVRTDPDVVVHYAPGCEAIEHDRIVSAPWLDLYDPDPAPMVRHALELGVDLVLVGHPRPLANGYVDAFRAAGLAVIGPDRAAARLESSKVFTKDLCTKYGIATAGYRWFDAPEPAVEHVREVGAPIVVKCDYSCQGNGVFVCETVDEAVEAIERLMVARDFGPGGARVVIEDKLVGKEQLFFVLVSGEQYVMLPMAVDYPRSEDGNEGPMCGG